MLTCIFPHPCACNKALGSQKNDKKIWSQNGLTPPFKTTVHSGLKWGVTWGVALEDLKCLVLAKIFSQTLLYHKIGRLRVFMRFSLVCDPLYACAIQTECVTYSACIARWTYRAEWKCHFRHILATKMYFLPHWPPLRQFIGSLKVPNSFQFT